MPTGQRFDPFAKMDDSVSYQGVRGENCKHGERCVEHAGASSTIVNAARVGLTAATALHTTEIFGAGWIIHRQAVVDGWLVDHEPPYSLITRLAEEGIHWDALKRGIQQK